MLFVLWELQSFLRKTEGCKGLDPVHKWRESGIAMIICTFMQELLHQEIESWQPEFQG